MSNLRVKIPGYRDDMITFNWGTGLLFAALMARFHSWLDKRTFRPHKFRGVLVGCIVTIVICEVACYRMLQSIVRFGNLPTYMPDMMIIVMALLEAMASPFVSWFGYWRRRTLLVVIMPILALSTISWLFLPSVQHREESEFCHGYVGNAIEEMSESSAVRMGFVLCSCVLFMLARVAVWCHGFAHIEEHAPEGVSVHLGVLVFVRTISLAVDYHMIGVAVKTSQVIGCAFNFVIQILQVLYFMPDRTPQGQERLKQRTEDRNFFVSIARVLANPLALTQMTSLGLLAAAVWGFGYHSSDIIKVKYLIHQKSDALIFFTEVFQYCGILMAALYVGLKWSAPIQTQFSKLRAVKQSVKMCVLVGVLVAVMGLSVNCHHGKVAGLGGAVYSNPSCSADCGCTAGWMQFSPVCVVDDMTTYLSPCQAGCAGAENFEGLMVYKNCSCAASAAAVPGACSDHACRRARDLYRMLYVVLLTFSVLAFQSHGVLLLKAVDARDKSVVMGLAGSVVSITAFVLGHLVYNGINGATCVWFAAKRCHMNSPRLPYLAGVTSAALAFTSAVICLITFISLVKAKNKVQSTRL